ncbi:MAG: glycosyltransferase family 39 protein [Planctomycetota bacterium]
MNVELEKADLDQPSATGPVLKERQLDGGCISGRMFILIGGILLLGITVRLVGLSKHTMGHNEIYIPGIKLPQDLANPAPRLTFRDTIAGTIAVESHPPGYYLLMLAWTKCFGTSLFSIRLPSVIFDGGTIVLIFMLAACVGMPKSGLLAALLWAGGGLATYLAQEARMYPMTCFLGVLSTLLLIQTYMGPRSRRRLVMAAYIFALLAGLSSSHFFWPILLVHIFYTLLGPTPVGGNEPIQLRWQLFVMALASPLLAVAAFQSGRESYLSPNVWQQLLGYLCLLFVWSPSDGLPSSQWLPAYTLIIVAPFCLLLLALGIHRIKQAALKHADQSVRCPTAALITTVGLAVMAITLFAYVTFRKRAEIDWLTYRIGPVAACAVVPLMALAADYLVRRHYLAVRKVALRFGAPLSPAWLAAMLAIIPVAVLALVSLRALVITGLLALNVGGLVDYRRQQHSPDDYAGITAKVRSQAEPDDLLFVFRHWAMTPIYYYLDSKSYNFVGYDHAAIIAERPEARVWVFGFDELPPPAEVTAPLCDHRRLRRVKARGMYSDLYVAVSDNSTDKPSSGSSDTEFN